MPTTRRRPARTAGATVTRRRDRAADVEETEDDDDVEEAPRARRTSSKSTTTKRRAPRPEDYDDEDEGEDDVEPEDDEDDEEPAPRRRTRARREPEPEEDEDTDEDEDDEEPAPRARRSSSAKSSTRRRRPEPDEDDDDDDDDEPAPRRGGKLPPGLRTGDEGAAKTRASGGSFNRITLGKEPLLIKFLEPANYANYRQHWVPSGAGQPDKPYMCIGEDCPLCEMADSTSATFLYNVLNLSDPDGPRHAILQIGTKADEALAEASEDRTTGKPKRMRGFFAVSRSGKQQQSQTNFRPVKERDLEDDWPEVFNDDFGPDDIPDAIAKAKKQCKGPETVQASTMKQLREVARYLTTDDD